MLARNVIAVLAVVVAVVFVTAFAVQAFDYSESAHATLHYTGKIVAIDPLYKILTIQAGPGDASYFEMRDDAEVRMCDKTVSFSDLKIGDTVSISYTVETLGGTRMATEVQNAMHC